MRLILDVDGVLSDFTGHTLSLLPEEIRGKISLDSWDILEDLPPEYKDFCREEWRKSGWCRSMPLLPRAKEFYREAVKMVDVIWGTAPMQKAPYWVGERAEWLEEHFSATPDRIVFTQDKSHLWGDFILDDKPENVVAWAEVHSGGLSLLRDQPYNRRFLCDKFQNIKRASNLEEALKIIEETVRISGR